MWGTALHSSLQSTDSLDLLLDHPNLLKIPRKDNTLKKRENIAVLYYQFISDDFFPIL